MPRIPPGRAASRASRELRGRRKRRRRQRLGSSPPSLSRSGPLARPRLALTSSTPRRGQAPRPSAGGAEAAPACPVQMQGRLGASDLVPLRSLGWPPRLAPPPPSRGGGGRASQPVAAGGAHKLGGGRMEEEEGGGGARPEERKGRGREAARRWGGAGPSSGAGSPASWGAADAARSGCAGTPRFPLKVASMGEGSAAPPSGCRDRSGRVPPSACLPGFWHRLVHSLCPGHLRLWPLLPTFNPNHSLLTLPYHSGLGLLPHEANPGVGGSVGQEEGRQAALLVGYAPRSLSGLVGCAPWHLVTSGRMRGLLGDCFSQSPLGIPREPGELGVAAARLCDVLGPNLVLEGAIQKHVSLSQIPSRT